jgi:hypothetical protein
MLKYVGMKPRALILEAWGLGGPIGTSEEPHLHKSFELLKKSRNGGIGMCAIPFGPRDKWSSNASICNRCSKLLGLLLHLNLQLLVLLVHHKQESHDRIGLWVLVRTPW